MLLVDLKVNNKGIFKAIQENSNISFLTNELVAQLDTILYSTQGRKEVSSIVLDTVKQTSDNQFFHIPNNQTLDNLGLLLGYMFSDKWIRLYDIVSKDIPVETFSVTEVEKLEDTRNKDDTISSNKNNTSKSSVLAFNTDTLKDTKADNEVDSESVNSIGLDNRSYTRTKETKGNKYNVVSDRLRALDYLDRTLLYNLLIDDVKSIITILTY